MPTFREALGFWFRLGFISFGGPAGQIAILHDFLVDKKRWISNSKFLHALNYCMLLPGPEAQQLATYTGWMLHGIRGGLAAGILFVLPSAIILWGLCVGYVTYGHIPAVQGAFEFLKPAVVAIVAGAIVKIGKKSLQTPLHYGVAVMAFVSIYFLNVPFPVIIVGAILLGAAVTFTKLQKFSKRGKPETSGETDETAYLINRNTVLPDRGWSPRRLVPKIGVAVLLWFIPLALFAAFAPNFNFWKKLSLFFTQAAFVTFGGAYAVLPYVAQLSVEKFGWLTRPEMLDGLALGETTPGPTDYCAGFCGIYGRLQYVRRIPFSGNAGVGNHRMVHLPAIVSLHFCRRTAHRTYSGKSGSKVNFTVCHCRRNGCDLEFVSVSRPSGYRA